MNGEINIQKCFCTPPSCTVVNPGRHVQYIVLHTMEAPEKPTTAISVARYFQGGAGGRNVSAHYCIDSDNVVQCVQTRDVAHAAPGANRNGIHIELAGYAARTPAEWQDAYTQSMLQLAAWLIAAVLAPKYRIPFEFRTSEDIRNGVDDTSIKGITTHWEVTKSGIRPGTHTDPGPNFPTAQFLDMISKAAG